MSRSEFDQSLLTISTEPSSATFTRADIANKITLLKSTKPSVLQKNELSRWQRVQDCFELVSYQGTSVLYLKGKKDGISRRVLAIKELYDKLDSLYRLEGNHTGRTKLYKQATLKYHGVTEKICGLFVKTCQESSKESKEVSQECSCETHHIHRFPQQGTNGLDRYERSKPRGQLVR